jgi:hypothetical protein
MGRGQLELLLANDERRAISVEREESTATRSFSSDSNYRLPDREPSDARVREGGSKPPPNIAPRDEEEDVVFGTFMSNA